MRTSPPPPPPPPRQTHSIGSAHFRQFQLPAAPPLDTVAHCFPVLKIEEDNDAAQSTRHGHPMLAYTRKMTTTSPWTSNESILRSPGIVDEDNKSSASSSSACDEMRAALSSGKSGQLVIGASAGIYAAARKYVCYRREAALKFSSHSGCERRSTCLLRVEPVFFVALALEQIINKRKFLA